MRGVPDWLTELNQVSMIATDRSMEATEDSNSQMEHKIDQLPEYESPTK
jgi:hypothetical protein